MAKLWRGRLSTEGPVFERRLEVTSVVNQHYTNNSGVSANQIFIKKKSVVYGVNDLLAATLADPHVKGCFCWHAALAQLERKMAPRSSLLQHTVAYPAARSHTINSQLFTCSPVDN